MNVITSTINRILNFGKTNSFQALLFGSSCCAEQLLQNTFGENSLLQYGIDISPKSPKHADLLICTGTINAKSASALKNLYQQMPEPKYVIAIGSCAVSGGEFCGSYCEIQSADSIIPVDICLSGCPPEPQELIDAIEKLKNQIKNTSVLKNKEDKKADNKDISNTSDGVKTQQTKSLGAIG